MGDIIDDFIKIGKEFDAVKKDFTGMASDFTSGGKPAKVVEIWDPDKYTVSIGINPDLCVRFRSKEATCRRCVDICPTGALRTNDDSIAISGNLCIGCGICIAACPSSALSASRLDSKRIYDEVAAAAASGEMAYVTCAHAINKTPQTGVKVVSCIGALRPELWFSLLADYPNLAIYLPLDACEACPVRGGEDMLGKAIEDAEKWSQVNMGFECEEKDLKLDKKYSVERAEFINGFLKKGVSVASKTNIATAGAYKAYEKFNSHRKSLDALQATLNKLCGTPEVVQTLTPDRQLLLTTLEKHRDLAAGIPLTIARTTDACNACGVCVEACPTGALRKADGTVKTVASYCTGCGLCRDVCAQGACEMIDVDATVLLKELTPDTGGIKELISEGAEAFLSSGSSATAGSDPTTASEPDPSTAPKGDSEE